MKFGMMYLFSEYGEIPQSQVFKEFLEEVELAEELGFDSIWLPEHHFTVYGMLGDTLTMASAIAQRTKKIKIGTAVVLLPLQHPVRVAEQAALVDCLSEGRLLLGVGRAYQPGEFAGFGENPENSRAMFFESMEILMKCFSGERFSHKGDFWQVEDVQLYPAPVQDPHPPIYMAAVSPPSYKLAAEHGLSILRGPRFTSMELVKSQFAEYSKYMNEAGRDPMGIDQPLLMQTFVAESDGDAKNIAEKHAMWYHELLQSVLPGAPGKKIHKGYEIYDMVRQKHAKVTYDQLADWGSAFGTPEHVAERIITYAQEAQTNHWMAEMKFGGMNHEDTMRSMRLFAQEVIPRVNDRLGKDAAA